MLVNLAFQYLSNFRLIPDLYPEIPNFLRQSICYLRQNPYFYADLSIFDFHCAVNVSRRVPVGWLRSVSNYDAREMRRQGGGGHVGGKFFCASLHAKLFWRAI